MSRSLRVRADLVPRVELAVKRNGFVRKKDLAEVLEMAESTVRKFRKGQPVDHAIFVEICQKLGLEWRDFADLGEITELHRESEEAVIDRYSSLGIEQTTPDTLDLAESEEAIAKPQRESERPDTSSIEERIFRATEQLKSRGFSALVGIQALEEIAKDSPRYHWKIMELLAAFVRNAPRSKEEEGIPDDIQAALTVIGQRDPNHDKGVLDLSNTDLTRAKLQRAKLQRVNFTKAHLEGANLYKAHLEQAILDDAHLEQVNLMEAHLEGASLERTHLEQATLIHAHLQGTKLRLAHLEFTDFGYASLERADLLGANLQDARLIKTNLEKADLCGANLRCAILQEVCLLGANLRNAALHEAHLEGTDITVAKNLELKQIQSAYGDSPSSLPLINVSPEYWKM